MKQCTKCQEVKALELFAKRAKNKDGLSSWCKSCFASNAAAKYQNDPNERARKIRNRAKLEESNRQRLWDYLLDHPCVDCGNPDPRVLEFDHVDEADKTRNVCEMTQWSWKAIEQEIAKCVVRCANCHRIRTQLQFGTWRGKMEV